jgi:Fe2+ transport system protein B
MLAMGALIYEILLNEGKVTDHLKRNWGKYAAGGAATAAALALAEPELTHQYHMHALKQLDQKSIDNEEAIKNNISKILDRTSKDNDNLENLSEKQLRYMKKGLKHVMKIEDANDRNFLNRRDTIWTDPKLHS